MRRYVFPFLGTLAAILVPMWLGGALCHVLGVG